MKKMLVVIGGAIFTITVFTSVVVFLNPWEWHFTYASLDRVTDDLPQKTGSQALPAGTETPETEGAQLSAGKEQPPTGGDGGLLTATGKKTKCSLSYFELLVRAFAEEAKVAH